MNLIFIQEHLKNIPLEELIKYSNGANPEVPPYLALGEIRRRNSIQEEQAKAPDQSVKERDERKALELASNQLMADQARQQQGSQQLAQQLAQPREEIPENVPQPNVPQNVPTYAEGGIARIPTGNIFKFDGGGIVTFAGGGTDTVDNPFYTEEEKPKPKPKVQPKREAAKPDYIQMSVQEAMKEPTMPRSPIEILEEKRRTSPVLQKPVAADFEQTIKGLSEQDIKNRESAEQRLQDARKRNFWQSLINAGEASRMGGGISSVLGGFGSSYNAAQAAEDEARARQEALRRQQDLDMAKINFEIQNLRRAEERGDIQAAAEHEAKIAQLKQKYLSDRVNALGHAGTAAEIARHNIVTENLQARQIAQMGGAYKPQVIQMAEYLRGKFPNMSEQELLDMASKYTNQGIAGGARMDAATMEAIRKIEDKYRMMLEMAAKDPKKLAEIQARKEAEIRAVTGGIGGITQPTQTPQGGGQWGKAEKVS